MSIDLSIRRRLLLLGIIGSIALCIVLLITVYMKSLHEAAELLDGELVAAARVAAHTLPDEVASRDPAQQLDAVPLKLHDYEAPLIVEAWSADGRILARMGQATAASPPMRAGFSDFTFDGKVWRSFVITRPQSGMHVRAMASADALDAIAGDIASTLAVPWLIGVPFAIGLLCWIVSVAIRPLDRLSQVIQSQKVDSLNELAVNEWPREVRPLITALNSLIDRLRDLRKRERDLVADAAHELRTPLTGIKLHAEIALAENDPLRLQTALGHIQQGSARLSALVTQLLDLARLDGTLEIVMADVSLGELVRQVIANLLPVADRHGVTLVASDNIDVTVRGDAALLETMFANLIANAIAHSPPNGTVEVDGDRRVESFAIRVIDQGPGIPVDDRDRVFERFTRLGNAKPGGTGLGLAIAKRVADLHSATAEIGDVDGKGCVVSVHFPLSRRTI